MSEFKPIAWGYTTRDLENGKEFLVAVRDKKDDPLRRYQLVLPGGGLEEVESYGLAAVRETLEETDIETSHDSGFNLFVPGFDDVFDVRNLGITNIEGVVYTDGRMDLTYTDSGKKYGIRAVRLHPTYPHQQPKSTESDAKNPRYESLERLKDSEFVSQFTPACQIGLHLIKRLEKL